VTPSSARLLRSAVLGLSVLAAPRASPAAAAGRIEVDGQLKVTCTVAVDPDIPAGTSVNFSIDAEIADTGYSASTGAPSVSAKVSGGTAKAEVAFPYTFQVLSTTEQISVGCRAGAGSATGALFYSGSAGLTSAITIPKNGLTTVVFLRGVM